MSDFSVKSTEEGIFLQFKGELAKSIMKGNLDDEYFDRGDCCEGTFDSIVDKSLMTSGYALTCHNCNSIVEYNNDNYYKCTACGYIKFE